MTDLDKLQALYEASPLAREGVTLASHDVDLPRTIVESNAVPERVLCNWEEDAELIAGLINAWPAILRELCAARECFVVLRQSFARDSEALMGYALAEYDAARKGEP